MHWIALLFVLQGIYVKVVTPPPPLPFDRYLAKDGLTGPLARPRLVDEQERAYGEQLTQGVLKGYGVVDGGTEHERTGVNFGGHYVLVQWGCGSDCTRAALVDGRDGTVIRLPREADENAQDFEVPTGSADMRSLAFRWNSRLLGEPHANNGMTYLYVLDGRRWRYVEKVKAAEMP